MRRRIVQVLSLIAMNPFVANFFSGRIYSGRLKSICVPALNCYSCPAALGACPLGSVQVMLGGLRMDVARSLASFKAWSIALHTQCSDVVSCVLTPAWLLGRTALTAAVSWTALYTLGFVAFVGAVGGRFACGWVCPFGLLQEVLYFRRGRKIRLPGWARLVKYGFLAIFVIGLPLLLAYPSSPPFCKYICPAGTIEGGAPLVGYDRLTLSNEFHLGYLFAWKVGLAVFFLSGMLLVSRFFCRTACPLGAAWGLSNRISLVGLEVDGGKCTGCGACNSVCPMDVRIYQDAGSAECIRCLKCRKRCPEAAIRLVVRGFTDGKETPARPRERVGVTALAESSTGERDGG